MGDRVHQRITLCSGEFRRHFVPRNSGASGMHDLSIYVIILCLVAFAFDFLNGFHDAANSIATVVSTRVMRPVFAVVWAAGCNFFAVFVFRTHVADTVGSFVHKNAVTNEVILAALIGAIFWDILTWYLGL